MKKHWWKLLSVVLLLYMFIAGMLVPLKPGIQGVDLSKLITGEKLDVVVTCYNTNFDELEEFNSKLNEKGYRDFYTGKPIEVEVEGYTRAWLKLSGPGSERDTALLASFVSILNPQQLKLTFDIPQYLPNTKASASASLVIDSPKDGAFILPGAFVIRQTDNLVGPPAVEGWDDQLEELHEHKGFSFPYRGLLGETIRNTYFHVSLWFALMLIMLAAAVYAGLYLWKGKEIYDLKSQGLTQVGLTFGILGLLTGMIWASFTWGKAWSGDIKQQMTAVALLIYGAYFVLRSSLRSNQQSARVGAAYNIFAYCMLIPLLYIVPRMYDSLHPGNGGNPGFGGEDLDNTMRMVFYPGIIGFTLLGLWIAQLWWRTQALKERVLG